MSCVLKCALALAVALAPGTVWGREEPLRGQIVGMILSEGETPDGLVQVYAFLGDFSRLGATQGYGLQLVGPSGEVLWGLAVLPRGVGESYVWYAAERLPGGAFDGWFYLDGHTGHPGHYGYGALGGAAAPRLRLSFDGVLFFPD